MFKTTGRLNTNLERSFSPEASIDIYNLKKIDGNLLSYIYSQDQINAEDSSVIHESLIKNPILQNEKETNYMSRIYQRPLKLNMKKLNFEEKKYDNYYLPTDGAFTRLIGEVSSSFMKKIKKKPDMRQKKSTLSKYLIKAPEQRKKVKSISERKDIEARIFSPTNMKKNRNESKNKSNYLSSERKKKKLIDSDDFKNNKLNKINIDLSKGGVVNLNINQFKKRYEDLEEEKIILIQNCFRNYIKNRNENENELKVKFDNYYNFTNIQNFLQFFCNLFKKEKKKLFNYLKKKKEYLQLKLIKRHLNYHKPLIKQKRKDDSIVSLNQISNYFLPSNTDSIQSLRENLNPKKKEFFELPNEFNIYNFPSSFSNLEYSGQKSICFKGKNKDKQNKNQTNSINLEDSEQNSIHLKDNKNVFPSSFIYLEYSKQNTFSFKGKENNNKLLSNLNLEHSELNSLRFKEESKEKYYDKKERTDENYLYFKEKRKENQIPTNRNLDYYKQNSLYFKEKQKGKSNSNLLNQNQNSHHFKEESKRFEDTEQNSLYFTGKQKIKNYNYPLNTRNLEKSEDNSLYFKNIQNNYSSSFRNLEYSEQSSLYFKQQPREKHFTNLKYCEEGDLFFEEKPKKKESKNKLLNLEHSKGNSFSLKEKNKKKEKNLSNINLEKSEKNSLYLKEKQKEKYFTNLEYSKQQTLSFKKNKTPLSNINQSSFSNLEYCELNDLYIKQEPKEKHFKNLEYCELNDIFFKENPKVKENKIISSFSNLKYCEENDLYIKQKSKKEQSIIISSFSNLKYCEENDLYIKQKTSNKKFNHLKFCEQHDLYFKKKQIEKQFINLKKSKQNDLYFKKKIKEKEKINPSSFSHLKYCELEDLYIIQEPKEKHFSNLKYCELEDLFFKENPKEKQSTNPSSFTNLKYSEQNSIFFKEKPKEQFQSSFNDLDFSDINFLYFRGERKQREIDQNIKESNDENLYKILYEQAEENLNKLKNYQKNFGFLYIRRRVNNLFIKAPRSSSFKYIQMDYPDNSDFMFEPIKKELEIKTLVNNIEIEGIKKNPYLWVKLPFAIEKIYKKYIKNRENCKLFINNLKMVALLNRVKKRLLSQLESEDRKVLRNYFEKYRHIIRKIREKERRLNSLKVKNEIEIEIERDIFNLSFHSASFFENEHNPILIPQIKILTNTFEKKRKKLTEFKLESIPKPRKLFKNKCYSTSRSASRIKKQLIRNERKRHRKLHFVSKDDLKHKKNYKQVKVFKKVLDDVTGKLHKLNVSGRSLSNISNNSNVSNMSNNSNDSNKKKCFAEILLHEDKSSKMQRLLNYNQLNFFFRYWKSRTFRTTKPKFYDIIKILMKCLFTDNIFIKAAFMGELFFIKGRYLLKWYWKTIKKYKSPTKKKSTKTNI